MLLALKEMERWICHFCCRLNITLADRDVSCSAYTYFTQCVERLRQTTAETNRNFTAQVIRNIPQYFSYERSKYLVGCTYCSTIPICCTLCHIDHIIMSSCSVTMSSKTGNNIYSFLHSTYEAMLYFAHIIFTVIIMQLSDMLLMYYVRCILWKHNAFTSHKNSIMQCIVCQWLLQKAKHFLMCAGAMAVFSWWECDIAVIMTIQQSVITTLWQMTLLSKWQLQQNIFLTLISHQYCKYTVSMQQNVKLSEPAVDCVVCYYHYNAWICQTACMCRISQTLQYGRIQL